MRRRRPSGPCSSSIGSGFRANSPPRSAILESLPDYSPPEGSTPAKVELSGRWDPATSQAELTWSAVKDRAVTRLELRRSIGPDYDPEDESVIATSAPDDPRVWTGEIGPPEPGTAASFKIYTLTARGHEHGSNPVTVTRPF